MKRLFYGLLILIFLTTLTSCGSGKSKNKEDLANKKEEKSGYTEVYTKAIEEIIIKEGSRLNKYKYVAIEMNTLKGITESEKDYIKKYFQDKYTKVKIEDFENIDDSLKYNNSYIENGMVIRFEKYNEFTKENISFEASAFIAPLASFGLKFEFKKNDDRWNMSKIEMGWIS